MILSFMILFLVSYQSTALTTTGKIPTECQPAIKCLNSTTLTFCGMIDGVEQNIGQSYSCPDGYECSLLEKFKPCIIQPPNCSIVGAGKYQASKCNQFYECYKTLWWWSQALSTCPQDQAFNVSSTQCVPIQETDCKL